MTGWSLDYPTKMQLLRNLCKYHHSYIYLLLHVDAIHANNRLCDYIIINTQTTEPITYLRNRLEINFTLVWSDAPDNLLKKCFTLWQICYVYKDIWLVGLVWPWKLYQSWAQRFVSALNINKSMHFKPRFPSDWIFFAIFKTRIITLLGFLCSDKDSEEEERKAMPAVFGVWLLDGCESCYPLILWHKPDPHTQHYTPHSPSTQ